MYLRMQKNGVHNRQERDVCAHNTKAKRGRKKQPEERLKKKYAISEKRVDWRVGTSMKRSGVRTKKKAKLNDARKKKKKKAGGGGSERENDREHVDGGGRRFWNKRREAWRGGLTFSIVTQEGGVGEREQGLK